MDQAFLIKQAISAGGVLVLIALAAWANIPRKLGEVDKARALALFADEFPKARIDKLWLADDRKGAIAKAGDEGLVLTVMGDGYVARAAPWAQVSATAPKDGKLSIALKDVAAPRISLAMRSWPPKKATA